jgi:soluble lytic murein transglycosylase
MQSPRQHKQPFYQRIVALSMAACVSLIAASASAQNGDEALLQMSEAFRKNDKARLAQLLPQVRGHALEGWAAYWELKARLDTALPDEVEAFYKRFAGTYYEDRLRNDWLLQLGQRRDWSNFADQYPKFRMNDDREVRCYAIAIELVNKPQDAQALANEARSNWLAQRDADDGCLLAADNMLREKKFTASDIWRKARQSVEANRRSAARNAVSLLDAEQAAQVDEAFSSPSKFLAKRVVAAGRAAKELVVLALIRQASSDPEGAAAMLENHWSVHLSPEQRSWAWAVIGKEAALDLLGSASEHFGKADNKYLSDDLLGWKVRAALRNNQWPQVLPAVEAMSVLAQKDSIWVYWRARAMLRGKDETQRANATQLLEGIAGVRGFYETLALEDLGRKVTIPAPPAPLTPEEKTTAASNTGLQRALQAIQIGLRPDGVREWNYHTNLHTRGGMSERELLAAADLACQREVWDRCINTSERTKESFDAAQRFPTPHKNAVLTRAQNIGLDASYVYGLIRQESRFIMDARSGVGASGLMQIMPATARWTARKIGMQGFTADQVNDRDVNIQLGTAYLKYVLDDFSGSMPMAAAAYNAGPNRPRVWRNGPQIDAAIWAENIPFGETRDYVKKVTSNATLYAALLTGQPQSLRDRLGQVGPREAAAVPENKELP